MKRYRIDLSLPPSQRWTNVIRDLYVPMQDLKAAYAKAVKHELGTWSFVQNLVKVMPVPVALHDELRGIAEQSGVPYDTLLGLNVGYDFITGCTSAVIRDNNNDIIHARTLDWDLPELKDLTIQADFIKDGRQVFKAITWAGFVGIYTAMSAHAYSVTLNYRKPDTYSLFRLWTKSLNLCLRKPCNSFMLRHALETVQDFEQFTAFVTDVETLAPCYLILASGDTGMVITKGSKNKDVKKIRQIREDLIVQTNDDIGHMYLDYNQWAAGDPLLLSSKLRHDQFYRNVKLQQHTFEEILRARPTTTDFTIYAGLMRPGRQALDFWINDRSQSHI